MEFIVLYHGTDPFLIAIFHPPLFPSDLPLQSRKSFGVILGQHFYLLGCKFHPAPVKVKGDVGSKTIYP
jgi:hypothetical protein